MTNERKESRDILGDDLKAELLEQLKKVGKITSIEEAKKFEDGVKHLRELYGVQFKCSNSPDGYRVFMVKDGSVYKISEAGDDVSASLVADPDTTEYIQRSVEIENLSPLDLMGYLYRKD